MVGIVIGDGDGILGGLVEDEDEVPLGTLVGAALSMRLFSVGTLLGAAVCVEEGARIGAGSLSTRCNIVASCRRALWMGSPA